MAEMRPEKKAKTQDIEHCYVSIAIPHFTVVAF